MSQMAKDFWLIGEARKGQMYWMYMTFSQRSGRTKGRARWPIYFLTSPYYAEVIMSGIFGLSPDVLRPRYADATEEAKLERMLKDFVGAARGTEPP
ncbi:MAG: hypothetical protein ABSC19_07600 [Syntrophorhabdales bacterium]|jgi:hypothetical protein